MINVPTIVTEWMAYVRGRSGVDATRFATRAQSSLEQLTVADLQGVLRRMVSMQFVRKSRYGPSKLTFARKHDYALCVQRYFYDDDDMSVENKIALAEIEADLYKLKAAASESNDETTDQVQAKGGAGQQQQHQPRQRTSLTANQAATSSSSISSSTAVPQHSEVIVIDVDNTPTRPSQPPDPPRQMGSARPHMRLSGANTFPAPPHPFGKPLPGSHLRYLPMRAGGPPPQLNQALRNPPLFHFSLANDHLQPPPAMAQGPQHLLQQQHRIAQQQLQQAYTQATASKHRLIHPETLQTTANGGPSQVKPVTNSRFVRVKQEYEDPDDQPRNQNESDIMMSLVQMGFQDRREILDSIRRMETTGNLSVDDVMVDIIQQREEAEEAKKMDEARKESEQTRKREAAKRKRAAEEAYQGRIRAATFTEWRSEKDMFPNSWLLQGSAQSVLQDAVQSSQAIKCKLLDLLILEKKARAWYGKVLPRDYFAEKLTQKFTDLQNHALLQDSLVSEVNLLEEAMYTLSQQQGGVPRIFLQVHDDVVTSKRNKRRENGHGDTCGEDEDEVVLVPTSPLPPCKKKCKASPLSLNEHENNILLGTPEIIEIQ